MATTASSQDEQRALDARLAALLPQVSLVFAVLFAVYAALHGAFLAPAVARIMTPLAGATAALFAAQWLWLVSAKPDPVWAHPIGAAIAALVALNVLLHMHLTGSPHETLGVLFVIVGAGSLFYSLPWFGAVLACVVTAWAALAAIGPPSTQWGRYAFAVLGASVLATLVQEARVRTLRSYEGVLRDRARHRAELQRMVLAGETELSERRELERSLRERENRYRLVAEHAGDMIWTFDPQGHFTYLSPSVETQLGIDIARSRGVHVRHSSLTESSIDEALRHLASMRAGERDAVIFEAAVHKAGGELVWCEVNAVAVRDGNGRLEAVNAVARDVSQRRATEEALRLTQLSVDNAGDSILRVGRDGRILFANQTACDALGYEKEELEALTIMDIHADYPPEEWEDFWDLLKRQELVRFESHQVAKDGRSFPVELVVRFLEYQGEEQAFAFVRDISERRAADEALHRAKEAAEAATRAKSEFLATMSHEIRTPMSGVIGMTELLLAAELAPDLREHVETLRTSGDALLRVIDNLLNFSKIEAGMLELEEVEFRPRDVIEDVAELFAPAAQTRGIEMIALAAPGLPATVRGDSARLQQILTNLASNAAKFTHAGQIVIDVRRGESGEGMLRFGVRDTGIGLSEAAKARIFEAFTQADASTGRDYGGTGLGLTVCRQLAELMGGSIGVESTPGAGSTFWCELPFAPVAEAEGAESALVPLLEGERLLVVGQSQALCDALGGIARGWRMQVTSAHDPAAALERVAEAARRDEPFRAVVIDLDLEEDALTLARAVRDQAGADAEIVLLAPLTRAAEGLARAREAGFPKCVTKPVRAARLAACLVTAPQAAAGPEQPKRLATSPGCRVLVAEDDEVNRTVAAHMLERLGVAFDMVEDGQAALQAVTGRPYAAVLMDCQMPNLDGFGATRRIREAEAGRGHTPIVAMTARAMPGDREKCLASGMDGHLAKPLRMTPLAQALRPWIETEGDIDGRALLADAGGDRQLVTNMAELFLAALPRRMDELRESLTAADAERVAAAAHTLRGSASQLGGRAAAEAAARLEDAGVAGSLAEAPVLLANFERALEPLENFLRDVAGAKA